MHCLACWAQGQVLMQASPHQMGIAPTATGSRRVGDRRCVGRKLSLATKSCAGRSHCRKRCDLDSEVVGERTWLREDVNVATLLPRLQAIC